MRSLVLFLTLATAALATFAGAALEVDALRREGGARHALAQALDRESVADADPEARRLYADVLRRDVRRGRDATAAGRLTQHAEAHPSSSAWRLAALASAWDG